ncbi:hypothetical protein LCGC14_2253260 [marine sediment metagenome]|uniref:Uncharacterized protein n=1 Tax=marine sediment metagenome TaxID=412755 RepID=A0A0F9FEC9_9ZZZZ
MECKECGGDCVYYFMGYDAWTCDDRWCKNYMKKLDGYGDIIK